MTSRAGARCALQTTGAQCLDIQREYWTGRFATRAARFPALEERALSMWQHCIERIENEPLDLDRNVTG